MNVLSVRCGMQSRMYAANVMNDAVPYPPEATIADLFRASGAAMISEIEY